MLTKVFFVFVKNKNIRVKYNNLKIMILKSRILKAIMELSESSGISLDVYLGIIKKAFVDVFINKYGEEAKDFFYITINEEMSDINILYYRNIVPDADKEKAFNKIRLSDARKIESDFDIGETCVVNYDFSDFTVDDINYLRDRLNNLRKIEKSKVVYEKYSKLAKDKKIVNVRVYRFFRNHMLLRDEDDYDLILPFREFIPHEKLVRGHYIKVLVKDVSIIDSDTVVIVSRRDNMFLLKLLELEIKEISDGCIGIEKLVRIPGVKSKVVVESYEPSIDPISICVGANGSKIGSIKKELSGEYIDFIKYSNDFETSLIRSFGVQGIRNIRKIGNKVFVYVESEFISNAIGRDGSNINLVRMLFPNLFIDVLCYNIKSENGEGTSINSLVKSFGSNVVDSLKNSGFTILEEIQDITKEELRKKTDLDIDVIEDIYSEIDKIIKK